jgi:hypothetical protein
VHSEAVLLRYFHHISNCFLDCLLNRFLHLLEIELDFRFVPYQLFDNYLHNRRNRRQFLGYSLGDFLCHFDGRFWRLFLIGSLSRRMLDRFPIFREGLYQLGYDLAIAENNAYFTPCAEFQLP